MAADVRSKISHFNQVATQHVGLPHSGSTNSFAMAASPTRSPVRSQFNSPFKAHSRPNSQVLAALPSTDSDLQLVVANLQAQLTQAMNRERLVAERVESLMEQLQSSHSRARHEKSSYEKELKLSNKAQYKSELALIRCQEELREARSEFESVKVRADRERQERDKAKQEAFERAYALAGVLEEVDGLKEKLKMVESERDALTAEAGHRTDLMECNMRDTACQTEVTQEVWKKEKSRCDCTKSREGQKQPTVVRDVVSYQFNDEWAQEELEDSRAQADWLRSQLRKEQSLVEFLTVQCRFKSCPCRMAEKETKAPVDKQGHGQHKRQQEGAREQRKRVDGTQMTRAAAAGEMSDLKDEEAASADQFVEPLPAPLRASDVGVIEVEDGEPTLRVSLPMSDPAIPTSHRSEDQAGIVSLSEAAAIPLPDPRSDDPEPTELLEDMTCVMVEPDAHATANKFTFSTSVSSSRTIAADLESATRLQQPTLEVDLFDLAPPTLETSRRPRMPARPSTSLGFATAHDSPIRMVPRSPEHLSASLQPTLQHRPLSHDFASSTPVMSPSGFSTRRIPLRGDSPTRDRVTVSRRSRSRSRAQSRTRGRSPTAANMERDHALTPEPAPDRRAGPRHQTKTQSIPVKGLEENEIVQLSSRPGSAHSSHSSQRSLSRPQSQLSQHSNSQSHARQAHNNHTIHITTSSQTHHQALQNHLDMVIPGTPITREAALAQIRARRDRARSLTRRKVDADDGTVTAVNKTPAKRGLMLRDISSSSQLSQASAPARI